MIDDLKQQARRLIELDGKWASGGGEKYLFCATNHAPAIAQAYLDQCEALSFLIARLDDFENGGMSGSEEEVYTQWAAHVVPAIATARKALGDTDEG